LVEQLIRNQQVASSSLAVGSTLSPKIRENAACACRHRCVWQRLTIVTASDSTGVVNITRVFVLRHPRSQINAVSQNTRTPPIKAHRPLVTRRARICAAAHQVRGDAIAWLLPRIRAKLTFTSHGAHAMKSVLVCLALIGFYASTSQAAVLGIGAFETPGIGIAPDVIDVFRWTYGLPANRSADIFDQIPVQTWDVGRTFTVTAADDPNFGNLTRALTNGTDDEFLLSVWFDYPFSGGGVRTAESTFFGHPGINGIDFQGFQISAISLRLDELTVDHSGSGFTVDYGSGTRVFARGDIIVEGELAVPEPSTLLLACTGLAGVLLHTRRRHA
jgi:hypothetical protein